MHAFARRTINEPYGGLAFAGAALFIKEVCQVFDLSAEVGHFTFESETVKAW